MTSAATLAAAAALLAVAILGYAAYGQAQTIDALEAQIAANEQQIRDQADVAKSAFEYQGGVAVELADRINDVAGKTASLQRCTNGNFSDIEWWSTSGGHMYLDDC